MGKRTLEVLKVLREKAVEAITKHAVTQKQACKMFGFRTRLHNSDRKG